MKPFKILALAAAAAALAPAFAMAASVTTGGAVYPVPAVTINNPPSGASLTGDASVTGPATDPNGVTAGLQLSGSADASSTDTSANGMLMITQQDVANSTDTSGSAMVTSSADVASDADFASYAKDQMMQDSQIKEVDATNNSVAVKYAEQGRFLGIFPVTMTSTATVAADGNVTFSYPWYHFLTTTSANDATMRTALADQASASLNNGQPSAASEGATSTMQADATLSASQKARILDAMRLVLSSQATASASTTASY
jgi:hypothetical protein